MDYAELRAVMARKEVKYRDLASKIGISLQSFYNKMDGKTDFKLTEIHAIVCALGLAPDEAAKIFLSVE